MLPPLLRESPDPKKVYSDRIWEEASILKTMHRVDGGKFEQLSYESFEYTTRGDRYYLRTTNDILIDPQGARFLATLAGTVAKGHVPLYLRRLRTAPQSPLVNHKKGYLQNFVQVTDNRTGQVELLVTKRCQVSPYQPKDFHLPTGYKPVKNLSDVGFSNSMKEELTKTGLEFLEPSNKEHSH